MACNCDTGLFDLGAESCIVNPDIMRKFIFVKYFKSDGTPNGIDLNSPFGETEIDALINNTDKDLRWFLTESVSNVASERADPNVETIDNVDYYISQGARPVTADFLTVGADISSKINSNRCVEMGMFIVDQSNGITGAVTRDGFLDPIRLSKGSMWAKVVMATEANIFKVSMAMAWNKFALDGDMRVLTFDDTATNMLAKRPLINVDEVSDAASTTTATIKYSTVDGTASGSPFVGLLVGGFTAFNVTTQLAVVVTAAPEGPNGTYVIAFAAQTTGDVVTVDATSAGFNFTQGEFVAL